MRENKMIPKLIIKLDIEKDFDKLTDKCIKWIKKNGVK